MTDQQSSIVGGFGGGNRGGGSQQPRVPSIASDTLQSKAFARVLDALSEGEIEGLVDGEKSIYLNETPLRDESNNFNFVNVTTYTRVGTQDQTPIEGFPSVETETSVGVTVQAQSAINGTWEREWWDATWTRSVNTITVTATAHGLSNGDSVFLNWKDYNGGYDTSYTISNVTTDTFDVTRLNTSFLRTSGQVKVLRQRLKINASKASAWTAGDYVFISFLQQSNDTTRTSSTLFSKTGTYNATYQILSSPSPTTSVFYIDWTDLAGRVENVVVDGGSIIVTSSTYTRSGTTVTITAPNHGLSADMNVDLTFRSSPMGTKLGKTFSYTINSSGLTADQFTVTHPAGTDTGAGLYFVDVPVTSGAITRTISDPDVDRVRIKINIPNLSLVKSSGDVVGYNVRYAIDAQINGGGYNQVISEDIKGKTDSGYTFDKEITLKNLSGWSTPITSNFPIDIRVRRVTEDASTARIKNAFNWQAYTEIKDAKLRYPNTALVGIEIDSEQFSSVPLRSYLIKGIKIRIPSNATVDSSTGRLTYSGTWDGTFAAATWCACPAWVLWDLLTSRRYGFGEQILTDSEKASFDGNASRLDKWSFYAASVYANQLISTGLNNPTEEARFSCNINIQGQQEAFALINELLSVFRSQAYWSNGSVTLAQDQPQDASYIFGSSNVINGDFSYSGSDIKTRPTVVLVKWFNIDTRDVATEVVEDPDLIAKYGVVKQEIEAFACTSQSQAARVGRWLLYSNAYETETVSFSIGIDSGVVLRPGMVIKINDQTRAATRLSGRISSGSTTTTVVIDVDRTVTAGDDLAVVLPNGLLETRTVSSYNSSTRTITVSTAFSVAPKQNGVWLLTTSSVNPTTWRVISIGEDSEQVIYGVTALSYNASKFDYVESGAALQFNDISILGETPAPPSNITVSENMYADNNVVFVNVSIGWNRVENATSYRVRCRIDNGNWRNLVTTESTQVDIPNAAEGEWQIQVYSIGVNSKMSQQTSATYEVIGKTARPSRVNNLRISQIDDKTAQLSWNAATDLDVLIGGDVIIRHTPRTDNPEWLDATNIIDAVAGKLTSVQVPLLSGTYMARFRDSSGNLSASIRSVVVTLPQPKAAYAIITFNEDTTTPPFVGNPVNMFYSKDQDGLILGQGIFIDSLAIDGDFDGLTSIDAVGDVVPEGEYEFGSALALDTYGGAGVFDVDMTARFVTRAFLPGDLWDDKEDLISRWPDIDGSDLSDVDARLYVRTTNDDPASTDPVFTEWEPLVNGSRRGRGFEFKVVATSNDPAQNIIIDQLGATVTMPRREETGEDITSGAGSYAVTFGNAFYRRPSIGVSGQNMATGDYYVITSVSRTGFTVTFRNSADAAVSRTFDWQAVGFGKQIT